MDNTCNLKWFGLSFSAETMILPAIPNFIVDLDISYKDSSWILAYI